MPWYHHESDGSHGEHSEQGVFAKDDATATTRREMRPSVPPVVSPTLIEYGIFSVIVLVHHTWYETSHIEAAVEDKGNPPTTAGYSQTVHTRVRNSLHVVTAVSIVLTILVFGL